MKFTGLFILVVISAVAQAEPAFKAWKNGGGLVHQDAKLADSVFVSPGSKVGACAEIKDGVVLVETQITCAEAGRSFFVSAGAVIEKSALNFGSIGVNAVVSNVAVNNESYFMDGSKVSNVTASDKIEVRENAVADSVKVIGKVEIRDNAVVRNTQFLGGYTEVRDGARVINSKIGSLNGGAMIRDGAIVVNSELPTATTVNDKEIRIKNVIVNK